MSGWKQWDALEVVDFDEFQSYLQDQVVQVYAGTAARGSALGTAVSAGMVSYLADTNTLQFYDGSAWQNVSSPGDITAVTAGTALTGGGSSGDVTLNVNYAAISTAIAGTGLAASGTTVAVDYAAVGSAVNITAAQISNLGTGVATFLTTPSSTNLASAVTGETGSGGLVFSNFPSLERATFNAPRFTVATTATAGGSTSLSGSGAYYQVFTGTLNQTISLSNSADTVVGTQWLIVNNSTGVLTIQTSTAAVVTTVNPATAVLLTCIATPITTAANYNTEIMYRTERVSQTNGVVTTAAVGSAVVRNITLSTAAPGTASGGMDGDVWLVYTP